MTYDIREAAEMLSVSIETIRRMVRDGRLSPLNLGIRKLIFSEAEIRRAIDAGAVTPPAHTSS